jgi:DNA-binding transcriptional LysR family regulator
MSAVPWLPPRDKRLPAGDLLVFSAVARARGVRAAATALGLARSTVSRQLAELEAQLGRRLITRSTRSFSLTEAGEALLPHCDKLEEVLRGLEQAARAGPEREPVGSLRIATSPVIGDELLPSTVVEYLRAYPRMALEVVSATEFVDLRAGVFDLAVRMGPLEDASDLYATRLGTSRKGLYASPSYLKQRGTPQSPEELSGHDCLVVGTARVPKWEFSTRKGTVTVTISGRLRTTSAQLARAAAAGGLGITRLPSLFVRALVAEKALVPVLESFWVRTTLYAVHASGRPAPPKIDAFVALLKRAIRGDLE